MMKYCGGVWEFVSGKLEFIVQDGVAIRKVVSNKYKFHADLKLLFIVRINGYMILIEKNVEITNINYIKVIVNIGNERIVLFILSMCINVILIWIR